MRRRSLWGQIKRHKKNRAETRAIIGFKGQMLIHHESPMRLQGQSLSKRTLSDMKRVRKSVKPMMIKHHCLLTFKTISDELNVTGLCKVKHKQQELSVCK